MTLVKKATKVFVAAAVALLAVFAVGSFTASDAYAEETSQTVTVEVQGTDISATFTKDQLAADGLLSTDKLGYQYRKPNGDWFVVGISNYIKIDQLFALAGASSYWTTGATLHYTCTDGEFTKYDTTYAEYNRQNFFYQAIGSTGLAPLTPKVEVPTVLGFSYAQEQIAAGSTSQQTLDVATFVDSTRFGIGCDDDTVNANGTDANMGKRMPQDIVKITIIPASAS